MPTLNREDLWPSLPLESWKETYATLHMWTQIVGKVRLTLSSHENHWWNSALYVTSKGLTTSPIPYKGNAFELEFNFIDHLLEIRVANGPRRAMALTPKSVAAFYRELMSILHEIDIQVRIHQLPNEVPDPIRFDRDETHASYDAEYANRFFRSLLQADRLLKQFRGEFIGKSSPVHFFWGSFDLACTRFSGRPAPERPGVDPITREAYSHEVISAGFWPGSGNVTGPAFYAYAAPEPAGFNTQKFAPPQAYYNPPTKNCILMYDEVRNASDPDKLVLEFLRSTYAIASQLAQWDISPRKAA